MEVNVATSTPFHWSGRHAAMPKCQSLSQTINSSKRRRYCRRDVYTSVVGGGGGSLSCQTRLNPSTFLGTESGKVHWSKSCELLKFTKNRTGMQKHYPLRRVCSASFSFFSDQDFSTKMQELALQFKIAGEEEDLERNKHQSERIHDKVKLLQESVPGLALLEAPGIEMVNHSSIKRKANSVDLPLSLRMIKRKLQEQALKEASESNSSSIYKAFSSMVFMIDELHSFVLQTKETIFYEEDLQGVVKKDMHASFLWIFQSVFSQTPTLMVYVMILLANFTVHSVASNLAIPASPVTKGQDQMHQRFESTLLGHVVSGHFDKISRLQEIREDELSLWNSIVEEADQMQDSPVVRDMRLNERTELDDYARTESLYEISLVQEPNNHLLLANYAQFLYLISQDYDRVEKCFKKAIESEEVDAETYSKYAVFQWKVLNDLWAAEENFLEAISADPTNSFYAANYANFLWQTGGEETCYPLESSDSPQ
ncbi:uncharacterized protein LOC103873589 [Brassica rapa]|uniref:Tetratricopeptide repeat-like superfamily protein n=2 Tax=Brassica TaxID=3705 RepID=A0ABQ8CZX5_BRANA|nr:uncharacterized protein LOC103873589 [Brassica rapa]XP_022543957.1 uncharacterized protein LOC106351764 [Brassica napus]XP_033129955.1 uncharacterized protein LOC103873589 [Brassica rapa]KAH0922662.1 hypothetical protein HID58_022680 [Brassica napus]